eukprot:Protomagalhaensia_wolfi_Nauph_80__5406@NODE_589_length_2243_cov_32_818058_g442_i0_p1_GENE_NODE_589_length_2243_cov_32_818058_g442_i0NODE_589_length_2243_cov_32_818058_g442_i0_p1_ORF_typecomplete_len267_score24_10Agarase_CBM/PF17992_1/0_15_NODE_589_length_2243_cov_32_818058_g442_i07881588
MNQSAPGTWNYASWCLGPVQARRRRKGSFTDVTYCLTNYIINAEPREVTVTDTWKPRASRASPDPKSSWLSRTIIASFIAVALGLAVVCGCVFGILMYRPVIIIGVAEGREAAAGSVIFFTLNDNYEWSLDGNIVLDLRVENPSYFPIQLEVASTTLSLVPQMAGGLDENAIVGTMVTVSSLNLPVAALDSGVFTFMLLMSAWSSMWVDPTSASWQCQQGYLLFEAYLSEIVHFTLGGRAGEQTLRTFPFVVPCILVRPSQKNATL